jgi:hypothetical protein
MFAEKHGTCISNGANFECSALGLDGSPRNLYVRLLIVAQLRVK